MVDTHLATDGAIHLCQERSRNVNEGDATEERGGGKTGCVADHSSAYRHNRAAPVGAGANQRLVDARNRLQVLEALPVWNQDRFRRTKRPNDSLAVEAPNGGTRYDETSGADSMGIENCARAVHDSIADPDWRDAACHLHVNPNRFFRQVNSHVRTRLASQGTNHNHANHGGDSKATAVIG